MKLLFIVIFVFCAQSLYAQSPIPITFDGDEVGQCPLNWVSRDQKSMAKVYSVQTKERKVHPEVFWDGDESFPRRALASFNPPERLSYLPFSEESIPKDPISPRLSRTLPLVRYLLPLLLPRFRAMTGGAEKAREWLIPCFLGYTHVTWR